MGVSHSGRRSRADFINRKHTIPRLATIAGSLDEGKNLYELNPPELSPLNPEGQHLLSDD